MQERDIKVIKDLNIASTSFEIDHVEINGTDFIRYRSRVGNEFNFQDDLEIKSQFTRKFQNCIGQKHYLFQYVEGKLLREFPKCSEHQIWKFVQQILTGLYDLHKNKSIGRCFNIHNILVTNKENIILMEFGYYPDLNFVLPEFERLKKYNYEADIFLLGLVIYFLMVGNELQFNHMNFTSQLEFQLQKIQNLQYSDNLKKIVRSCLDINPTKRCRPDQILNSMDQSPLQIIFEQFYKDVTNSQIYKEIEQKIIKREKLSSQIMFSMRIPQKLESRIVQQTAETLESMAGLLPPQEDEVEKIVSQFQLDYVNYYHNEDHLIWIKLNLLQYRFKFLQELATQLESFDQSLIMTLPTTIFCLKKMRIIYMGQFLQKLELKDNIVQVNVDQWNNFRNTSLGLQKMYNQIKAIYDLDREILKQDLASLKQILNQNYPNKQEDQYFPQYEGFLDLKINCAFDEVKIKYRLPLNLFYNFVDQTIMKSKDTPNLLPIYKNIKLRLLMAITVNRSLDPDFVFSSFKVAAQFQGIEKVTKPEQIYQFLQFADVEALDGQIQEIHNQIFA